MMQGKAVASNQDVERFIRELRRKDVSLWVEGNMLRYRAPKGALTAEERRRLIGSDGSLIALLTQWPAAGGSGIQRTQPAAVRRAPLSFTQLAHWRDRCDAGGGPILAVASATRLRGNMDVALLNESLQEVQRRHDALRVRILSNDGITPVQEVTDGIRLQLETVKISQTAQADAAIERQMRRIILEPGDYAGSSLFRAALISIDKSEHVLVLALDHIISDGASLNILIEEILTGYGQLLKGGPVELPAVATQFPSYAAKLRSNVQRDRFGGSNPSRTYFPDSRSLRAGTSCTGWEVLQCRITCDLSSRLRALARQQRTTVVMATLSAYAALVLRWCDTDETIIPVIVDGRIDVSLEHTVGYLAFPIYPRVVLDSESTFMELLKQITNEYCNAYDEADFGRASCEVPRPGYTRNTSFNWRPGGRVHGDGVGDDVAFTCAPVGFSNPGVESLQVDQEPCVDFSERDGAIIGQVSYPRDRFSRHTMQRFTRNLTAFLEILVREPTLRVKDAPIL